MKFHHIGIAVKSINNYYNCFLKPIFGVAEISDTFHIEIQNVNLAFATTQSGILLELIESTAEDSPASKILKRNAGGLYHIGFLSKEFKNDIEKLKANKCKLIYKDDNVVFFFSPHFEIFEIIDFETRPFYVKDY